VAVQALNEKKLPFISVLADPTFGGVSASYAMQADVRIAVSQPPTKGKATGDDARIGFAGPAVILNTMCEGNQARYDAQCPTDFQSAPFVRDCGQIDMVLEGGSQQRIEQTVAGIARLLTANIAAATKKSTTPAASSSAAASAADIKEEMLAKLRGATSLSGSGGSVEDAAESAGGDHTFNYTRSRLMDRPQTQDILLALFGSFVELRYVPHRTPYTVLYTVL
jgi:hypothetical protein